MLAAISSPCFPKSKIRITQRSRISGDCRDISQEQGSAAGRSAADKWTEELKAKGHDGVILPLKPGIFDKGKPQQEIVVFDPAGVKSATGNKGTFDPKNPNINESIGERPQPFTDFPPDIGFPVAQLPDVPSEPTKKKKPDDEFTRPIAGDEEYQAAVRELLFPPLDLNTITRIIYAPTDGVGWPERLAKWSTKFANPDALASQIATGLSQGQDLRELSKSVKDSFGVAGSTAKRVARSESHRVNLMAHDEASKGLGELATGSMY